MLEDVHQVALRHSRADLLLEVRQADRLGGCRQALQAWRAIVVDTEFGVVGQAGVDLSGRGSHTRVTKD
jgi:hypothetical protein